MWKEAENAQLSGYLTMLKELLYTVYVIWMAVDAAKIIHNAKGID